MGDSEWYGGGLVMEHDYKGTILIVDDTKLRRKMLRDIFAKHNFEVVGEAADGKEAVTMYEELLPDLTTMDITMPNMDGIQALTAIREIDPAAQVVIVSAVGFKSKIMAAVKAGAKNFIVKPFVEEKVIEVVNSVLKQ